MAGTILETAAATASYRNRCQDRVAVFDSEERTVIVVADGAGGVGAGEVAAESVLREIEAEYPRVHSADQWADTLRQIDFRIAAGETTAVVVDVRPYGIAGASVGDSRAWIIDDGAILELTERQNRKPLLGSGNAAPVAFMHTPLAGLLLAATDGFCDYAKREALTSIVARADFHTLPRRCIELVRLPSGELWDDVGIVAARNQPRHRTRKQYSIP